MTKGMVRRIDDLGRATIPIEYRRSIDLKEEEAFDLYTLDKVIHLKKGKGRKLDALGRYTIPIEVRRSLRFELNEMVDIYVEGDEICIKREMLQCVICGSDDENSLMEVDGVLICRRCGMKVIDKFAEE
jgi:transcriptional pleiotropic regulator of transition state genes